MIAIIEIKLRSKNILFPFSAGLIMFVYCKGLIIKTDRTYGKNLLETRNNYLPVTRSYG
jgi:hypothetical protein